MKGFTKDGKFRPTGSKTKSSLKKSDIRKKRNDIFTGNGNGEPKPVNFYKEPEGNTIHKMTPKEFLDITSSSGLEETGVMHNSGIISDLGGVHSDDPNLHSSFSMNHQAGGDVEHYAKYHYEWIDGEQVLFPKKYYIMKDKDDNYTKDFHKYIDDKAFTDPDWKTTKGGYYMEGLDEKDFIDEDTPPILTENRINPILSSGEDTRNQDRLYSKEDFDEPPSSGRGRQIFRGDELGSIEYLKRKIRKGEPIEIPFLDTDAVRVKQHEGRHRARALMEEGIDEVPVNFFQEKVDNPHHLIPQNNSFKEKYPSIFDREEKDTRYPIKRTKVSSD